MGMYKMCPGRIVKSIFSKLTADTSFEIVQEYIDDKTDHQKVLSCILLIFSVALETVNPKI